MMALEGLFRKLGPPRGETVDSILRRMVALRVPRGVEDAPSVRPPPPWNPVRRDRVGRPFRGASRG